MVSSFNFISNHPSDKYITIHQRQIEIIGLPDQNPLCGDPVRICCANRREPGTRLRIASEILLMKLYSAQHRIYKKLSPYLHRQTSDLLSVSISHTYYICNYTCISPRSPRTGYITWIKPPWQVILVIAAVMYFQDSSKQDANTGSTSMSSMQETHKIVGEALRFLRARK